MSANNRSVRGWRYHLPLFWFVYLTHVKPISLWSQRGPDCSPASLPSHHWSCFSSPLCQHLVDSQIGPQLLSEFRICIFVFLHETIQLFNISQGFHDKLCICLWNKWEMKMMGGEPGEWGGSEAPFLSPLDMGGIKDLLWLHLWLLLDEKVPAVLAWWPWGGELWQDGLLLKMILVTVD